MPLCSSPPGPLASGRGGPFSSAGTPLPGTHRSSVCRAVPPPGGCTVSPPETSLSGAHLFRDLFLFCRLPAFCMCCGMISSISTKVTFFLLAFGRPASEKEHVGELTGASEPDHKGSWWGWEPSFILSVMWPTAALYLRFPSGRWR